MSERTLFNQTCDPVIVRATEEVMEDLGPLHQTAVTAGGKWEGIHEAVNKTKSAESISHYMEYLLQSNIWRGSEELRKKLNLQLTGVRYFNWQLIARIHAAGIDYIAFPTLRDLIKCPHNWGLGITEEELEAFVRPHQPALWGKIAAALNHAQPPGRKGEGEIDHRNVVDSKAEKEARNRSRALGRALDDPRVRELVDAKVLATTPATEFGVVSRDSERQQLKKQCLDEAYAAFVQHGRQENPATKKAVRAALAPLSKTPDSFRLPATDLKEAAETLLTLKGEEWATSFLLELADLLKYHP